jgi:prepilin-type N-terminal cleavage/methylation domain-containing protein
MECGKTRAGAAREGGFTLVEVIVAVSILAIGLLAVASLQTSAITGNYRAYKLTEGTTWAQDKLEYLMGKDYDDAELNLVDPGGPDDPKNNGEYQVYWKISLSGVSNAKLIEVWTEWEEKGVPKASGVTSVKPQI